MTALETFLLALVGAIAQAFAQAIVPAAIEQIQTPSGASDAFVDAPLQAELADAIAHPQSSAAD